MPLDIRPQHYKKGQSGNPKGRPLGSKNKIKFDIHTIMAEQNCNPFKVLAQIALGNPEYNKGEPVSAYVRKEAASELCSYILPKLKAVEISAAEQQQIAVSLNCASPQDRVEILGEVVEENNVVIDG